MNSRFRQRGIKYGGKDLKQQNKQQIRNGKVKIIPLGGLEQIGMNITAIEYEDSIIVIDCGLAFPSDDMLGIDLCISVPCPMCCRRSMCRYTVQS